MTFGDFPPPAPDLGDEEEAQPRVPRRSVVAVVVGAGLFFSGVALGALAPSFFSGAESGRVADSAALALEALREGMFGRGESGKTIDVPLGNGAGEELSPPTNLPGATKGPAGSGSGNVSVPPPPPNTKEGSREKNPAPPMAVAEQAADPANFPECSWLGPANATRELVVNEVAWMGSPAESASLGSANEWVEVRNAGSAPIPLRGLRLVLGSGGGVLLSTSSLAIPPGGFALFERSDDASVPNVPADGIFTGSLANAGAWLRVFGGDCRLLDEVDARSGWPAGDAGAKKTMARASDLSWFTSATIGGTPRRGNTPGAVASPTPTPTPPAPPAAPSPVRTLTLAIVREAGAGGSVLGSGVDCSAECTKTFSDGAELALTAAEGAGSVFAGWSGACSGMDACAFALTADASVTARFAVSPPPAPTSTPSGGVVILEVMVGRDGASNDEFVELYNTSGSAVDLTGWTIRKRSSSGNESGLVSATRLSGKSIPAGKHFLLGNEGGYASSVVPDASWATSAQLAYANNAVILMNAEGAVIDEATWVDIPPGTSIVRPSPQAAFEAASTPNPENSAN